MCLDSNEVSRTGLDDFIDHLASLIESSEGYLLCDNGSSFWQQFLQCHAEKK